MKKTLLLLAFAFTCPLVGQAETVGIQNEIKTLKKQKEEIKDQARFHKMIDSACEVYSAIAKGPQGEVPASVLKNARCVAILPNVITGALLVGGTMGEGVASCLDKNGKWSQPAPISLKQGSLGLQAGGKSTDLVLFFQNQGAVDNLKRGNFQVGTDISAVAGNYDSKVDTSTAGIVVFNRTEGLFAGTSINGSTIGNDAKDLDSYYGKQVSYTNLLEGREMPDSSGYTEKLTKLLP